MVLREETIERFGYDPATLSAKSNRYVVAQCNVCGKQRHVQFKQSDRVCRKCGTGFRLLTRKKTDCAVPGAVELPERPCRLCGIPTRKERQLCSECADKVLLKEREIDSRNGVRHLL